MDIKKSKWLGLHWYFRTHTPNTLVQKFNTNKEKSTPAHRLTETCHSERSPVTFSGRSSFKTVTEWELACNYRLKPQHQKRSKALGETIHVVMWPNCLTPTRVSLANIYHFQHATGSCPFSVLQSSCCIRYKNNLWHRSTYPTFTEADIIESIVKFILNQNKIPTLFDMYLSDLPLTCRHLWVAMRNERAVKFQNQKTEGYDHKSTRLAQYTGKRVFMVTVLWLFNSS